MRFLKNIKNVKNKKLIKHGAMLISGLATVLVLAGCPKPETREEAIPSCKLLVDNNESAEVVSFPLNDNASKNRRLAQSFVPNEYHKNYDDNGTPKVNLAKVSLRLKPQGSPSGFMTLSIQKDNSFVPNGDVGAVGAESEIQFDASAVTKDQYYTITLAHPVLLSMNTRYWIVLRSLYASSDSDNVIWVGIKSDKYSDGYSIATPDQTLNDKWFTLGTPRDFQFGMNCD